MVPKNQPVAPRVPFADSDAFDLESHVVMQSLLSRRKSAPLDEGDSSARSFTPAPTEKLEKAAVLGGYVDTIGAAVLGVAIQDVLIPGNQEAD